MLSTAAGEFGSAVGAEKGRMFSSPEQGASAASAIATPKP